MNKLYFLSIALLLHLPLWAQQEEAKPEIITDRPDQTESAFVVPWRTVQLESGAKTTWNTDRIRTFDYNGTLVRVGVLKFAELRVSQEFQRQEIELLNEEITANGFGALTLGTKVKLWDEKGYRPRAAVLVDYVLPTGSEEIREESQYLVRASFSHELTDKWGVGYNLGGGYFGDDDYIFTYTLAVGRDLTDKLGAFIEVFGEKEDGLETSLATDGGFTYLLLYNLQLDLSGGIGLTESAEDGYVSLGVSWRFSY